MKSLKSEVLINLEDTFIINTKIKVGEYIDVAFIDGVIEGVSLSIDYYVTVLIHDLAKQNTVKLEPSMQNFLQRVCND